MSATYSITLGANGMSVTRDIVANNTANIIPKKVITYIGGVFNQKPLTAQDGEWLYGTDTMTVLIITTNDGITTRLELQSCSNQPTWNNGTQAALNTAIAAINAWNA